MLGDEGQEALVLLVVADALLVALDGDDADAPPFSLQRNTKEVRRYGTDRQELPGAGEAP